MQTATKKAIIQEFTDEEKAVIGKMILQMCDNSGMVSDRKFAISIGFSGSDISNLRNESWRKNQQLIGASKWLRLAQKAKFNRGCEATVEIVQTETLKKIQERLHVCQQTSSCDLLCDSAGIGKSTACEDYQRRNPNVMYINCSSAGKLNSFKRAFAMVVGVPTTGRINDCFETAIIAVKMMHKPLLILDEGGDLEDKALIALKQIYNETEDVLGIFLVGAGGLKKRLESGRSIDKPGFDEVFSRFGKEFRRITPDPCVAGRDAFENYMRSEMMAVLAGNGFSQHDIQIITANMKDRDLRAIKRSIKLRNFKSNQQSVSHE